MPDSLSGNHQLPSSSSPHHTNYEPRNHTKTAAAEPNRIDVIVLCRDAADTPAGAAPDLDQAAAQALSEIQSLREAGLRVGPGDVRTAVRAAVLTAGTRHAAADWEMLQAEADQQATAAVAKFNTT